MDIKELRKRVDVNVMLDLETLGTGQDAVIVSIGACMFDPRGSGVAHTFHAHLNLEQTGRTVTDSTIRWWMHQSDEARSAAFGEHSEKQSLPSALNAFAQWFCANGGAEVWGNGATFDVSILEHAYRTTESAPSVPWAFYNVRDLRTLRALPVTVDVPRVEPELAHDALSDAIAQAKHVQAIYKKLMNAGLDDNPPTWCCWRRAATSVGCW